MSYGAILSGAYCHGWGQPWQTGLRLKARPQTGQKTLLFTWAHQGSSAMWIMMWMKISSGSMKSSAPSCISVIGNMNADIVDANANHMIQFCQENNLLLSSKEFLPSDSYTCHKQ